MATETSKRVHFNYALDWLREAVESGVADLMGDDGKPAPKDVALAAIAEKQAQGYRFYPMCDATDAEGVCLGHPAPSSPASGHAG